jgi:HAD superfamily hydrolase (TIGR01549 family)
VKIPQFPVYLFDVDGTLVDSAADICGAIQGVLRHTSQNAVPDAYLRRFIGRHLVDLYAELFPDYTAEQIDALVQEYRTIYPQRNHASTFAYPGVVQTLKKLGGRKATATTKGTPTTRIVLERFGMLPYFEHVQGTDGFPAKPAPDVIFHALAGLGARVEDCLFVGDSPADMEAARAAGVRCCAATYGYGQREDLAAWAPDYWLEEFGGLVG